MKKIITLLVAAALLFTLSADIFAVAPEIPAPAATAPLTVLNFTGSFSCYNYELPDRIAQMLTNAGYDYKLEEPEVDPKDDLPVPLGGADFASVAVIKDKVLSARLYYYQWSINYQTGATEYEFFTAAVYHSENFGTGYKLGTGMTDDELAAAALDDGFSVNPANPKLYSNGKYNLEYKIADSGNEFILMTEHRHDEGYTFSEYGYDDAHHWRTIIGCWCNMKEYEQHVFYNSGFTGEREEKCHECDHAPEFQLASLVGMDKDEALELMKKNYGSQFIEDMPNSMSTTYDDGMGLKFFVYYNPEYAPPDYESKDVVREIRIGTNLTDLVIAGKFRGETTYGDIKEYIAESGCLYKEYSITDKNNPYGNVQEYICLKLPNTYVVYYKQLRGICTLTVIGRNLETMFHENFITEPLSELVNITKAEFQEKMKKYEYFIQKNSEYAWNENMTEIQYEFWFGIIYFTYRPVDDVIDSMQLNLYEAVLPDNVENVEFYAKPSPTTEPYYTVGELKEMASSGEYKIEYSEEDVTWADEGAKNLIFKVTVDGVDIKYYAQNFVVEYTPNRTTRILTDEELMNQEAEVRTIQVSRLPEFQRGDLDGSGKEPNVTDGVIMQRILAGIEDKISAADLNNDGIINVADGVTMQRILAGLE